MESGLLEKRRRSSSSSSSTSSSSDSTSSSSRSRRKEKRKKEKKSKKSKKHKKEKKKHKKEKKSRDKDKSKSTKAVNQNEYGKFGIIKEEHYFNKQREFEVYMSEVKKIDVGTLSKRDQLVWFKSYIEDYNTATMPHEKYYNIASFEMMEYQRQKYDEASMSFINDEELLRMEKQRMKQASEKEKLQKMMDSLKNDKDKASNMRNQDILKSQMQIAFRSGDDQTVRKIERLLAPDED